MISNEKAHKLEKEKNSEKQSLLWSWKTIFKKSGRSATSFKIVNTYKRSKLVISLKIPTWRKLSQLIQREISMISNEKAHKLEKEKKARSRVYYGAGDNIKKSGRSATSFKIVNMYKRS